jgi:hypothetical protein
MPATPGGAGKRAISAGFLIDFPGGGGIIVTAWGCNVRKGFFRKIRKGGEIK